MNLVEAVSLVAVHIYIVSLLVNKTSIFSYALLKLCVRDG